MKSRASIFDIFRQILSGLFTGLKLAFWLAVIAATALFCATHLKNTVNSRSGDGEESAEKHFDLRRKIALAVNAGNVITAGGEDRTEAEEPSPWKPLPAARVVADGGSAFQSQVLVHQSAGVLHYRVVIGPYNPVVSRELKASSGWVTLKFHQKNNRELAALGGGIRIDVSSFEFFEQNGLPAGWVHAGSLRLSGDDETKVAGFSLGWVLPESLAKRARGSVAMQESGAR